MEALRLALSLKGLKESKAGAYNQLNPKPGHSATETTLTSDADNESEEAQPRLSLIEGGDCSEKQPLSMAHSGSSKDRRAPDLTSTDSSSGLVMGMSTHVPTISAIQVSDSLQTEQRKPLVSDRSSSMDSSAEDGPPKKKPRINITDSLKVSASAPALREGGDESGTTSDEDDDEDETPPTTARTLTLENLGLTPSVGSARNLPVFADVPAAGGDRSVTPLSSVDILSEQPAVLSQQSDSGYLVSEDETGTPAERTKPSMISSKADSRQVLMLSKQSLEDAMREEERSKKVFSEMSQPSGSHSAGASGVSAVKSGARAKQAAAFRGATMEASASDIHGSDDSVTSGSGRGSIIGGAPRNGAMTTRPTEDEDSDADVVGPVGGGFGRVRMHHAGSMSVEQVARKVSGMDSATYVSVLDTDGLIDRLTGVRYDEIVGLRAQWELERRKIEDEHLEKWSSVLESDYDAKDDGIVPATFSGKVSKIALKDRKPTGRGSVKSLASQAADGGSGRSGGSGSKSGPSLAGSSGGGGSSASAGESIAGLKPAGLDAEALKEMALQKKKNAQHKRDIMDDDQYDERIIQTMDSDLYGGFDYDDDPAASVPPSLKDMGSTSVVSRTVSETSVSSTRAGTVKRTSSWLGVGAISKWKSGVKTDAGKSHAPGRRESASIDEEQVLQEMDAKLAILGPQPDIQVSMTEPELQELCQRCRLCFMSQPMLLELEAPLKIVGDIHGQYYDLLRLFEHCGYPKPPRDNYLFLGDYVDRGSLSLESIALLFAYKLKYPENVFLLRGNHEAANINKIYGFYEECKRRFSVGLWKVFCDAFNTLPVAAVVGDKIMCMHGGLSPMMYNINQIKEFSRPTDIPDSGLLCDILWSDPDTGVDEWGSNDRGVSVTFGAKVVDSFLRSHDLDLIARAHQVVEEGYEFFAKRRLVTIFSAPNYCGEFDNGAAVMSVKDNLMCSFQILKPRTILADEDEDSESD